jgi:hypothetical protein
MATKQDTARVVWVVEEQGPDGLSHWVELAMVVKPMTPDQITALLTAARQWPICEYAPAYLVHCEAFFALAKDAPL